MLIVSIIRGSAYMLIEKSKRKSKENNEHNKSFNAEHQTDQLRRKVRLKSTFLLKSGRSARLNYICFDIEAVKVCSVLQRENNQFGIFCIFSFSFLLQNRLMHDLCIFGDYKIFQILICCCAM